MSFNNFIRHVILGNSIQTSQQALQADMDTVLARYGIIVEPTGRPITEGGILYELMDGEGRANLSLGHIELKRTSSDLPKRLQYQSGDLLKKIQPLAKIEKDVLHALAAADLKFYSDIKEVQTQTGISFNVPSEYSISDRTRQGTNGIEQIVYVNTESNSGPHYSSSVALGAGVLWVGVTEPVPGVHSYPVSARYHEGQFMETLLVDSSMVQAYIARVNENALNIPPGRGVPPINWVVLAADLARDQFATLASLKHPASLNGRYLIQTSIGG